MKADGGAYPVADRARVESTLDTLARSIHAHVGQDAALVGIRRRGSPLAQMLAERLGHLGRCTALGEIELTRYSEDLTVIHDRPRKGAIELPFDVGEGKFVLVDDVLYSGRTLLQATQVLLEAGARRVACAVLCSRGPTEVPIQAAFVGMRFDLGPDQIIEVRIPPFEADLEVVLRYRPAGSA